MTNAEAIAKRFHLAYEQLAPQHGYTTREKSRVPWEQVPDNNRALMVATVADLLEKGIISPGPQCPSINFDTQG